MMYVLVVGHQHLVLVPVDVEAVLLLLLVSELVVALTGQRKVDALGPELIIGHHGIPFSNRSKVR